MGLKDIAIALGKYLPEVKAPEKSLPLKTKLLWTALVLVLFFALGKIRIIGIKEAQPGILEQFEVLLASQIGTIITAGIGPVVLASIFLQLFVGSGILQLDLTNPSDRVAFQYMQKLLAIVLAFVEGFAFAMNRSLIIVEDGMLLPVVMQIALGSIILLYLDEVVSKYGIGSGIGLFIAGGVSGQFFWQVFMPPGISEAAPQGGLIARFLASLSTGADFLLLFPLIMFVVLTLIIVYAEGVHVNIPLTIGLRGFGGRYPVKLLYVSNIPVILAVALFANIKLFAALFSNVPIVGDFFKAAEWATTSQFNLIPLLIRQFSVEGINALFTLQNLIIQEIVYIIVLSIVCVVFGLLWVELAGQGPDAIAKQLQAAGMHIAGFRRDERIIKQVLQRYIPTITILGSLFVALLSAFGDMVLGTLASGTGILLTVGIVYRMYEEIAREQIVRDNKLLSKLFG